jgi:hypothetical protein
MNKQIKLHPCIILDMIQNTKREICGPKSIGLGDGPTRKDVSHLVSLSIHPQYRHMIFLIKNPIWPHLFLGKILFFTSVQFNDYIFKSVQFNQQ